MDPLLARLLDEAEARQLPSVIAEWEQADDARRWIARALRLDLAHLGGRVVFHSSARFERHEFQLGFSPTTGELWWKTNDGDVFSLDMKSFQPRRSPDDVMVRRDRTMIDVDQGLLVIGDVALPIDDVQVIRAPDANRFAGATTLVELVD